MSLQGKHIVLGVTGGIAAYKIPLLVRLLVKEGASVQVVMTRTAKDFVSPLTLSVLSKRPVYSDFVTDGDQWINHVELARRADLMLIAPLTAATLAKIVSGEADNLLTAVVMSAECPVLLAPAMDLEMYRYPAVRDNLRKAEQFGMHVIPAEEGELASGLHGQGRMPEPGTLLEEIKKILAPGNLPLLGKKVLVTAGPTYEDIDPVRYLGNRSSGKMGIALAEAARRNGAEVMLISGPSPYLPVNPPYEVIRVRSAGDMARAVQQHFPDNDILIMAAAVADYTPVKTEKNKIKKQDRRFNLELQRTKDILAEAGKSKRKDQFIAGFALETDNEEANALKKLKEKNADMIILNSLRDEGAGFEHDTNKIRIFFADGTEKSFPLKSKNELAQDIINEIALRI